MHSPPEHKPTRLTDDVTIRRLVMDTVVKGDPKVVARQCVNLLSLRHEDVARLYAASFAVGQYIYGDAWAGYMEQAKRRGK